MVGIGELGQFGEFRIYIGLALGMRRHAETGGEDRAGQEANPLELSMTCWASSGIISIPTGILKWRAERPSVVLRHVSVGDRHLRHIHNFEALGAFSDRNLRKHFMRFAVHDRDAVALGVAHRDIFSVGGD